MTAANADPRIDNCALRNMVRLVTRLYPVTPNPAQAQSIKGWIELVGTDPRSYHVDDGPPAEAGFPPPRRAGEVVQFPTDTAKFIIESGKQRRGEEPTK